MRRLSNEEADLWAKVVATVRPLSREPLVEFPKADSPPPPLPAVSSKPKGRVPPPRPPAPPVRAPATHRGATLDGHWERRLKSGSVEPERVLDLHGHSLDSAWEAIDRTLERAIERGERVILLVTGHARPGEPPVKRGKIRAAVHDWLAVSRHADRIAAVRGAHRRHGGGGSLYLILRRG
ncbi:Smr/MutS family protein [Sphingomonas sp. ASV193]|uniref:Smr/MutS family protein n=1 Tax=Sphingomonas sp. ASV193 TaxID=3144405 RepID=UPI0032E8D5A0